MPGFRAPGQFYPGEERYTEASGPAPVGPGSGSIGATGSATGKKGATTAQAIGRVGAAAAESARKGATSTAVGAAGARSAAAGAEGAVAFAVGRVGLSSSEAGIHNAHGASVAAVGAAAAEVGRHGGRGSAVGNVGASASAFGSQLVSATGSAIGAAGLTGFATGIAGFSPPAPQPEQGGGGIGRKLKRLMRVLFAEKHEGGAQGSLGLSGRARGVAFIPTEIEAAPAPIAPPPSLEEIRRLLERIRDIDPASEPEIESAPVIARGFTSIRLGTHGAASGLAFFRLDEPAAPPEPVADPDTSPPRPDPQPALVVVAGFSAGSLQLTGAAQGVAAWALEKQFDEAEEVALIAMLDELADIDMVS